MLYEENYNFSSEPSVLFRDEVSKKYPSDLAKSVIRIVETCLKKDPEARPDLDVIVLSLSRTLGNSFNLGTVWRSSFK